MRDSLRIAAICSFAAALLLAGGTPARAHAQDQSQNKDQAQAKDPAAAKDQAQTKDEAPADTNAKPDGQAGAQPQPATQPDSLAEAARKAREKKGKQDPPKVYTEEDMSKLSSHGVSVVGEGDLGGNSNAGGYSPRGNTPRDQEEAYWRGRAGNLLNQMSATDAQIERMKEEIKKYGNGGFDPATGLTKNVIYFQDRQAQLEQLQKRRADLDRQMDQLQEEGRKAGASSSWFR